MLRTGRAAKLLGVHKVTVLRWIKEGKIKAVRFGKEYRIPEDEIKRLIKGKTTNTAIIYARVSFRPERRFRKADQSGGILLS